MAAAFDRVIRSLEHNGNSVRSVGVAKAIAQCAAHEDRNPSLSVTGIEGRVLLHCHEGCEVADVASALGLTVADLFDEPKPPRRLGIAAHAVYNYDGGRTVIRSADKSFRQENTSAPAELFRLSRVIAAVAAGHTVAVVEGEQDVLSLESLGVTATTSPMGAGKASRVDWSPLNGANIIIIADKDEPGRKHAAEVTQLLHGIAASVSVVEAKVGKDATDHIAAGFGIKDFVPGKQLADSIVDSPSAKKTRTVKVTWADTIEAEPVTWAWADSDRGRIPAGSLSLAAGREGTGKSSFGIWLTARITTGTLPGHLYGRPRRVLYVAVEDSWKHTLVPRLTAAGADLSLVGRVEVTTTGDDELVLSLPDDLVELEKAITSNDVAAAILDPLLSLIGERIDTHRNREVREALDPLARLADRTGAVLLGIAHFNKSGGTDAASLISGSGAFKDVPRSVFGFARDDDGRVMTQVKNSLGRDGLPSLNYEITSATVDVKGGVTEVGKFAFGGDSDRSVADILRDARGDDDDKAERHEASDWLTGYLTDSGGQAPAADVIKAAKSAGYNESTIKKTRSRIKVTTTRIGFGKEAFYSWALPHGIPMESMQSSNRKVESMDSMPDSIHLVATAPEQQETSTAAEPTTPQLNLATCGHLLKFTAASTGRCAVCITDTARAAPGSNVVDLHDRAATESFGRRLREQFTSPNGASS